MSGSSPGASALADGLMRQAFPLQESGDLDAAAALYRRILEVEPGYADAHFLLGTIARGRGELPAAVDHFARAVAARPDEAAFHEALGQALLGTRAHADAASALRRAVELAPDRHEAWNDLGCAHRELHEGDAAMPCFERALALVPDFPQALYNGGGVLRDLGRIDEALAWLERARALAPDNPDVASSHVFTLNLSTRHDRAHVAQEHFAYGRRFGGPAGAARGVRPPRMRLRVGYFSPDLRSHPVACFLEPVLRHHDRSRIEVCCFHLHPEEDAVSTRLRGLADRWVNGAALDDASLASAIRAAGVDVLVDLAGHTGWNRLPVLALKPAPVLATWLGYLNTTGLPDVDYRITDPVSDPPGSEGAYTERLVRLPHMHSCYTPPPADTPVAPSPVVARGRPRFGSFNKSTKVNEPLLRAWGALLRAVPDAELLVVGLEPSQAQAARAILAREGVADARVDIRGRTALEPLLELHARVDIALDTHPYSGTTTTLNSLWMGVPVVTLAGASAVSRSSASILTVLGLADWVAGSWDEYVRIAAAKAADPAALARLRAGLRPALQRSPLMDGPGFTRGLEQAYFDMWNGT